MWPAWAPSIPLQTGEQSEGRLKAFEQLCLFIHHGMMTARVNVSVDKKGSKMSSRII